MLRSISTDQRFGTPSETWLGSNRTFARSEAQRRRRYIHSHPRRDAPASSPGMGDSTLTCGLLLIDTFAGSRTTTQSWWPSEFSRNNRSNRGRMFERYVSAPPLPAESVFITTTRPRSGAEMGFITAEPLAIDEHRPDQVFMVPL